MSHLSPEELLDVVEGAMAPPHLAACASCRQQVVDLRDVMNAAASVDVPEPSPLFWDHFSARVRDAVAAESQPAPDRWRARWPSWRLTAAAGAAVVAMGVGLRLAMPPDAGQRAPEAQVQSTARETISSPGDDRVAIADDASLGLLGDLAEDLDWDGAAEAGITVRKGVADGVLMDLSSGERLELQRLLKAELAGTGA